MRVLDGPLVFVDIETNGLSHIRGRVVEVAAIRVEGGQVTREFTQLIDPGSPLPHFITQLTGITQADLACAPLFTAIADELLEVLDGAVFVAHNVRFDYSFLKQEFKRIGKDFRPQQLCTVRLSRALFPEHRTHKLQDLITRHNLEVGERHRAYADAHALLQFTQRVQEQFPAEALDAAIARQLKKPSLPKGLDPAVMTGLPEAPGVYIFEDKAGSPIYVGKSVNIKKRVASHFTRDHDNVQEFKLSQHVRHITVHPTAGELQALLLESKLVKELQPLYNRQLRKIEKLLLAKEGAGEGGYLNVRLEEAQAVTAEDVPAILAVYDRRGRARSSLLQLAKDWQLCPKLLGLEKARGACFSYQLNRCRGACAQRESADIYNARLRTAFAGARLTAWPYAGPVLVREKTAVSPGGYGVVVDQWCVLAEIAQADDYSTPRVIERPHLFDLDTYKIIRSFLTAHMNRLTVRPISLDTLAAL